MTAALPRPPRLLRPLIGRPDVAAGGRGLALQSSGGAELVFAENLRLSASQCGQVGLAELQGALRLLSRRFQLLQLSAEEAVMLKAVALGNAGTPTRCSLCPTRKQSELSPDWLVPPLFVT